MHRVKQLIEAEMNLDLNVLRISKIVNNKPECPCPESTQQKKVVFCAYDSADGKIGGPIAWAIDLVDFLRSAGVDLSVVILKPKGNGQGRIAETCRRISIPFELLDVTENPFVEDQAEWILECCRRIQPTVVVANLMLPAMFAAKFLRPAGIQTITVIHSNPAHDPFYCDVIDLLIGSESHYPDVVVSVASFIDEAVGNAISTQPIRREVIACGCRDSVHISSPARRDLKLIYAGRLVVTQKRIHETTDALLRVSRFPGVLASICGDGSERQWVIDRLNGQSAVQYLGQLTPDELGSALARTHVLVLLSDFEGLPIALVEGMACGLVPVCLASIQGINEVVTDGVNGLLVSDRDEGFDVAIRSLQDPAYWQKLSDGAQRKAKQTYSHSVTFTAWLNLLNSLPKTDVKISKIARRVSFPYHENAFNFAVRRPTWRSQWQARLSGSLLALRCAIRPRVRIRKVLNLLAGR